MVEKKPEIIDFIDVDFSKPSILKNPSFRYRRCPVIVTLADSQIGIVDIQKMLEAGMNVAKFKMSSSTRGDKMRLLGKIDKASSFCCQKYDVTNWPIATCVTLKTCIIKTGILENNEDFITLKENSELILTHNLTLINKCNATRIFVDNPLLGTEVKPGAEISVDADEIILKCTSVVNEKTVKCVVTKGGKLSSISALCARNTKRLGPLVTKKDFEMVKFALEYQIDTIIISYVRHPDTVKIIKKFIKTKSVKRPILLSGISCEEGLKHIDDIIKESDGIILSREYLPYEMESFKKYRMPHIQKWLAGKCLQAGKTLYLSGGIFENALKTCHFHNYEISDVTNALLDGVSGFVLGECFNPDNIIEVLHGLNELCYSIEPLLSSKICFRRIIDEMKMPLNAAEATALSCATVANQANARVVVIPTVSGKTVRFLNRMRLSCIIITVSTNVHVTRLLHTYRGVMPLMYTGPQHSRWKKNINERIFFAIEYAVRRSLLEYGDTYITLQRGSESSSFCDMVRIWKVSISKRHLVECPDDDEDKFQSTIYMERSFN